MNRSYKKVLVPVQEDRSNTSISTVGASCCSRVDMVEEETASTRTVSQGTNGDILSCVSSAARY